MKKYNFLKNCFSAARHNFAIVIALLFSSWQISAATLFSKGAAQCEIILEQKPTAAAQFAAYELQHHFELITGQKCEIFIGRQGTKPVKIHIGNSKKKFAPQQYSVEIKGNTITLAGCDEADFHKVDYMRSSTFPDYWKELGSLHAAYDFLELLGVRWYLPTELGTVAEKQDSISVKDTHILRKPTMEYRDMFFGAYPEDLAGDTVPGSANDRQLNMRDTKLWFYRSRHGGKRIRINHSFYSWYPRFLKTHPEYFARGYEKESRPPQLCYSNPEVLKQTIQDARDFFDRKKDAAYLASNLPKGYISDVFPVFPMDNRSWCKCPECQRQLLPQPNQGKGQFSNDRASNYIFNFVNKVAREVAKTHPGKYIGAGTYAEFCFPPSSATGVEKNVMIIMCLHNRLVYSDTVQKNDRAIVEAWSKAYPSTPKIAWMYYCFPWYTATSRQTRLFPGFFARKVNDYFRFYRKANVIGMFWEPSYLPKSKRNAFADQLEGYINWKLAYDESLSADMLYQEFFTKYYGPAAKPMKAFYECIENAFTNPKNYPPNTKHQTDEIAWKNLGTAQRMQELQKYMEAAKKAAPAGSIYAKRVSAFDKAIFQYMQKGKKHYDSLASIVNPSMQQAVIKCQKKANGNPAAIDWRQSSSLRLYGSLQAAPLKLPLTVNAACDGEYLYLKMEQKNISAPLKQNNVIWLNDEFEFYFAGQRGMPFRQLGIDSAAKYAGMNYSGTVTDSWDFPGKISSDVSGNKWTMFVAVKLADIIPGGIKRGQILYFNVIRSSNAKALACWIPTFAGFKEPSRFGELYLE